MLSELYNRDQYRNKAIEYIISADIVEYDIKSAGLSISNYYKLLDKSTLDKLYRLPKHDRHVAIGKLCRENKEYNESLKQGFVNIRKEFFKENDIQDDDVLSIKKDAIFLLRRVNVTQFGDCVTFDSKNTYTSYYYINKKEFYNSPDKLDVKGINDDILILHRDYMLDFMHNIFNMMETSDNNERVIKELVGFTDAYKNRELEIEYYRELNEDSSYRLNKDYIGYPLGLLRVGDVSDINIAYNYMNYIRPIIQIVM